MGWYWATPPDTGKPVSRASRVFTDSVGGPCLPLIHPIDRTQSNIVRTAKSAAAD